MLSGSLPDQAALHGMLLPVIIRSGPVVEFAPRRTTISCNGRSTLLGNTFRVTSVLRRKVASMSAITASASHRASSSASRQTRTASRGRFARLGLATVVAATAANTLVYFIGGALVPYDPRFLPLAGVSGAISFTLPAAIVAVLLYATLLRCARTPDRTFTIIAAIVFAVTLIPDFSYIPTVPGATGGQTAILVLMHIAAASVIVRMLTTLTRPQE
jgi:hypothetical protein